MPRIDNNEFYNQSILLHGLTPKGVRWNSSYNQQIRFEVIAKALRKYGSISLVDAGCGFGDFYLFAQKLHLPLEYIGVDKHQQMVAIAQERTQQTILNVDILKDKLPIADLYIASGSLNILTRFETTLFLKRMIAHAKRGVIFNMLHGDETSTIYNHFLPNQIKSILRDYKIQIIEGYLEGDFTVVLEK